jgi:hypothetical protein
LTSKNLKDFYEQFSYFDKNEIIKIIEYGVNLWIILKKIYETAKNRSDCQNHHLKNQFD